MEPIQGNVSIDAQNIMPIIKKWLYSDKDIFIREVVSNGCDAITKLRMVDSSLAQGASVRVQVDKAAKELRFIDDGIGMTAQQLPHIWERFYQADPARGASGAGLGLAMVRFIVQAHGGEISVRSISGAGTVFTFSLPLEKK